MAKRVTELFRSSQSIHIAGVDDVMKDANQHNAATLLIPTNTPEAWFITQSS
jgi:hypothetical protein